MYIYFVECLLFLFLTGLVKDVLVFLYRREEGGRVFFCIFLHA